MQYPSRGPVEQAAMDDGSRLTATAGYVHTHLHKITGSYNRYIPVCTPLYGYQCTRWSALGVELRITLGTSTGGTGIYARTSARAGTG
jgi:hypothetical protein